MTARSYDAAGGVVFDALGRVLVLDRPSRFEVRLPKGHVDPGETALEAACREVAEEAGFAVAEVLADLGDTEVRYTYRDDDITRREHYFAFSVVDAPTVARRLKDAWQFQVRWLERDEAVPALTYDSERQWVLRAVAAFERGREAPVTPDTSARPPACRRP
jgi:8-oxo-dGTP pyrophosphatase MutT (NUDIX family)